MDQEAMVVMFLAELNSAIPIVSMRPSFFKDPLLGWMQGRKCHRYVEHPSLARQETAQSSNSGCADACVPCSGTINTVISSSYKIKA
jgi:hypothetical protein